jgi:predicted transcriptional regulator
MFSRVAPLAARAAGRFAAAKPAVAARPVAFRTFTTLEEALTAEDARKVSGYADIDYAVDENALVFEAVQKMAAYNIGCLVTTDSAGKSFIF